MLIYVWFCVLASCICVDIDCICLCQALDALDRALQQNPSDLTVRAELYFSKGNQLREMNQLDRAFEVLLSLSLTVLPQLSFPHPFSPAAISKNRISIMWALINTTSCTVRKAHMLANMSTGLCRNCTITSALVSYSLIDSSTVFSGELLTCFVNVYVNVIILTVALNNSLPLNTIPVFVQIVHILQYLQKIWV